MQPPLDPKHYQIVPIPDDSASVTTPQVPRAELPGFRMPISRPNAALYPMVVVQKDPAQYAMRYVDGVPVPAIPAQPVTILPVPQR